MGVYKTICVFTILIVSTTSLPLRTQSKTVTFPSDDLNNVLIPDVPIVDVNEDTNNTTVIEGDDVEENDPSNSTDITDDSLKMPLGIPLNIETDLRNVDFMFSNQIREGMVATSYDITLEPNVNAGTFSAVAIIRVQVDQSTIEDSLIFHADGLENIRVRVASGAGLHFEDIDTVTVDPDDQTLEIDTGQEATLYTLEISYTGSLASAGIGFYTGNYQTDSYLAMNLHPTYARRVFPCIDEPSVHTTISFNFVGLNGYQSVFTNSKRAETQTDPNQIQFQPLQGVTHLWGMVAHNLNTYNIPITNVVLYAPPGRSNQDSQANVAINNFFTSFQEWTGKPHEDIITNQEDRLHIMAMPDVDKDWYALSTICIWEPYVMMDVAAAVFQRKMALIKLAEAISRQWFGFIMVPSNWRYQWVVTGLSVYSSHKIVKAFQTDSFGVDESLIDMNAVFVSDIIQESLLNDAYTDALPLEAAVDLFDEDVIRDNINGLMKTKAPAILHMLDLVLDPESRIDFIQQAAAALLQTDALSNINSRNFYDTLINIWNAQNYNKIIDDIIDFLENWVLQNNYPLIRVDLRQGGVVVTQERFGYSSRPQINYMIPISYTTSLNPNFDDISFEMVMETTQSFDMVLDEEDWVLFNIQGQGYYRVNYDNELWERIIETLEDPDRREEIHPINRATLVDDSLNLARAGKIDYEIAFRVVLTMEHEIEYVVWKAFVRSMEFLRVRLTTYVDDDEDLDPDIYLRMVRRTVGRLESELSFTPELNINEPAMTSLARGLVMQHACKVGYQPCIAAAIDWFRDPNNRDVVNPNIPADIRPAVYCANAMSGGEDERSLLFDYLDTVNTAQERVNILEGLACSTDGGFIQSFLDQTIAANSPYNTEERNRIFKAVVSANPQNARTALNFLSMRTIEIRRMYGGAEKLEDLIHHMARHLGDRDMTNDFTNWVNSLHSNLDDSLLHAERLRNQAQQDLLWDTLYLDYVYEWIDENDAHTVMVSAFVISLGLFVALMNQ